MKTICKILAFVLVLTVACFIIAACGNNSDTDNLPSKNAGAGDSNSINSNVEDAQAETTDSRLYADIPEDTDFGGYKFNIFALLENKDVDTEEQNADTVNDAVYIRNRTVEEKLGIEINVIQPDAEYADLSSAVTRSITADDQAYDAVYQRVGPQYNLALKGRYYDFNEILYIDMTQPWWDQQARKGMSINNELYVAVGDISTSDKDYTWILAFNKNLLNDLGLESPYKLVNEKRWTYNAFYEMVRAAALDLNDDGKLWTDDKVGMVTHHQTVLAFYFSSGERVSKKDENDYPSIVMNTERASKVMEETVKLVSKSNPYTLTAVEWSFDGVGVQDTAAIMFTEKRALFFAEILNIVPKLRDMKIDFGLIPYPMLDESQDGYHTMVNWSVPMYSVPSNAENIERTGIILETLANESRYTLIPAYYDTALKTKFLRDEESTEILDLIFATRVYDVAHLFKWGGMTDSYIIMAMKGEANFASLWEKNETKLVTAMERSIEAFSNK